MARTGGPRHIERRDAGGPDNDDGPRYSYFRYYSLPIVKLMTNTLCYIGFIILSSIVLVAEGGDWKTKQLTAGQVLLFIWVFALVFEELSQIVQDGIKQYWRRDSNRVDSLMLLLYIGYMALRFATYGLLPKNPDDVHPEDPSASYNRTFVAAVDLLALATIMSYLRILHVFAFNSQLGPLYFVITRLVSDVARWLFIFVLFCLPIQFSIMAFAQLNGNDPWLAVTSQNDQGSPGSFGVAFFTIIGDYSDGFAALQGPNRFAIVVLVIYALVAQIVLVNLLIAMMGDTFGAVRDTSDKEWKFVRYSLATEYMSTSLVPPPFNILAIPYKVWIFLAHLKSGPAQKSTKELADEAALQRRIVGVMKLAIEELEEQEEDDKDKDKEKQKPADNVEKAPAVVAPVVAAPVAPVDTSATDKMNEKLAEILASQEAFRELLNKKTAEPAPVAVLDDDTTRLFLVISIDGQKYTMLVRSPSGGPATLPTGKLVDGGMFDGDIATRLQSIAPNLTVDPKPLTRSVKNSRIYLCELALDITIEELQQLQEAEVGQSFVIVRISELEPEDSNVMLALSLYFNLEILKRDE